MSGEWEFKFGDVLMEIGHLIIGSSTRLPWATFFASTMGFKRILRARNTWNEIS